ncbi:kinase-like domain-containing protein [Pisolithus thermaeus]|nr:kinase-like domain-containing protein [Pisolithus thermaeus]
MGRGSARSYVQDRRNDPRPLIRDIAEGLHYLHSHPKGPIIHGDLKGDNVLIDQNGRALLTDFGLSVHINSSFTMTVNSPCGGSLYWMAPELVEDKGAIPATTKSDVWSFGMTALVCQVALLLSDGLPMSFRNFSQAKYLTTA